MKIGMAVFAYNRYKHLEKVLNGLKNNEEVDNFYIFQDGLKSVYDREDWEKTKELIDSFEWCNKKVIYSSQNRGLAQSIVEGINRVLKENDAVIVLEDDCVPMPAFITFMKQCLIKYKVYDNIYSVSGYSWPMEAGVSEYDAYFCGRPCPWGWGTWKNRWDKYKRDYDMVFDIKNNQASSKRLAMWGQDFIKMLAGNILGKCNSWYVFWGLQCIKDDALCINPYKSLVQNIGFDGTGVHCSVTEKYDVSQNCNFVPSGAQFRLEDNLVIHEDIIKAFQNVYGYCVKDEAAENAPHVLIYGTGNRYMTNCKVLNQIYHIDGFIDTYKKDIYFAGLQLLKPYQLVNRQYDYIIITIENVLVRDSIVRELQERYKITSEKIKLLDDVLEGI